MTFARVPIVLVLVCACSNDRALPSADDRPSTKASSPANTEDEAINAMVLESARYTEQIMILATQFDGDCAALIRDATAHLEPVVASLRRRVDDLVETDAERERIAREVISRGKAQRQVEVKLAAMGKTMEDVTEAVDRINAECADYPGWTETKARLNFF
ncbi:MAG: hypothetical protein GY811_09810 [Myxococcales bacterium]|nr:hypothetical protein [Myxococcales bacterium]